MHNKHPNESDLRARADALEDCAAHLHLSWSSDPSVRSQRTLLAKELQQQALRCLDQAAALQMARRQAA